MNFLSRDIDISHEIRIVQKKCPQSKNFILDREKRLHKN